MINKVEIKGYPADKDHVLPTIYEREGTTTVHGDISAVYVSSGTLVVLLRKMPERIDYDPYFNSLIALDMERTNQYDKPYTILTKSPKESITVWQRRLRKRRPLTAETRA